MLCLNAFEPKSPIELPPTCNQNATPCQAKFYGTLHVPMKQHKRKQCQSTQRKHHYTAEERNIWLQYMIGTKRCSPMPMYRILQLPGHPDRATQEELLIVGGWALQESDAHHVVNIDSVQEFVKVAFKIAVDDSWVSRHMHALHFTRHRPRSFKWKYAHQPSLQATLDWLNENQPIFAKVKPKQNIVAMDQMFFFSNGIVTSSYAPIGVSFLICTFMCDMS